MIYDLIYMYMRYQIQPVIIMDFKITQELEEFRCSTSISLNVLQVFFVHSSLITVCINSLNLITV